MHTTCLNGQTDFPRDCIHSRAELIPTCKDDGTPEDGHIILVHVDFVYKGLKPQVDYRLSSKSNVNKTS